MAGFKHAPNYDYLKGLELSQIQVNPYTLRFIFVELFEIEVASELDHFEAATGKVSKYQTAGPTKDFTIQRLPGRKIADVEVLSDDALELSFDNGDTVTLLRTDPRYECAVFNKPDGDFFVIM